MTVKFYTRTNKFLFCLGEVTNRIFVTLGSQRLLPVISGGHLAAKSKIMDSNKISIDLAIDRRAVETVCMQI